MTRPWNESALSEEPAVQQLVSLGWTYCAPETLEAERDGLGDCILTVRLREAVKRLNPWLTDANLHKAVRDIEGHQAASLLEVNQHLHTLIAGVTSVRQDRGAGKKGHDVRYVDYSHPEHNEFLVTRQFRVQGARQQIVPDIILFCNGIPVVVIECKSPTLGDKWREQAIEQLTRYQELEERFRELGAPRLFSTVQLVVGTCGQGACYGTVGTPHRHFSEWKTSWPLEDKELEQQLGHAPNPQELLIAGMLTPANLLDLIRHFTVFEHDAKKGRTIRKVCRYQQFRAVNQALLRARASRQATERGGVIWHTQGSGKSLTMLWLALKLRQEPALQNPMVVIVTDRLDLDEQITSTLRACGYPNPIRATEGHHLREQLAVDVAGQTILTTIQKFRELADRSSGEFPALNQAKNIFVLADEAHRTQYGGLAANMRAALPNAGFFGFSGTPIDKRDRSTLETFGPYIDQYTIEQAVADGAVVPIFYESRLPELRLVGQSLDQVFERVFADRSDEERQAIRKQWSNEQALCTAPRRIEAICLDLLEHFRSAIQPNGFKAQVVASSREAAVLYKATLDRLNGPESCIAISRNHNDPVELHQHHLDKTQRKLILDRFKKPGDPLEILVVCDMLLTGFDAPVEQVMYLDAPLREHTLLQAVARVNRTEDGKTYGLVVDYWGVSEALQEALEIFSPSDIKGALAPKGDELPRLQARHQAALRFFVKVKDKSDLEACIRVLEPEDVRAEFSLAYRRFAASLDMVLPDPKALPYVKDGKWLGRIRQAAAARYRDEQLDISDCGAKVRQLIDEAVVADGIQILVTKVPLFSPKFTEKLDALKSDEARASEIEHAIRHEITVRLDQDPAFYGSLRERLEQIIQDAKARRIDAAQQLSLLDALKAQLGGQADEAQQLGLSSTGYAILGLLGSEQPLGVRDPGGVKYGTEQVGLAGLLEGVLQSRTEIVDWPHKPDVQREMRRLIKRNLPGAQYPDEAKERIAEELVELLKRRQAR